MRVERDFAFGMPAEAHATVRRELLPLTAPAAGDVVDDDAGGPHAPMLSPPEPPRERTGQRGDHQIPVPANPRAEPGARRAIDIDGQRGCRQPDADLRAHYGVLAGYRDRRRDLGR